MASVLSFHGGAMDARVHRLRLLAGCCALWAEYGYIQNGLCQSSRRPLSGQERSEVTMNELASVFFHLHWDRLEDGMLMRLEPDRITVVEQTVARLYSQLGIGVIHVRC